MPKLDITDLDRELRQGKIRPIYIIVGAEHHLAMTALRGIQEAVKATGTDPLSVLTLTGREARAEAVIGALRTVPMLGGRPLVVIREGEQLSKEAAEALAAYMEAPVEAATLAIVASKLDGRSRLMQQAAKGGAVIECKPLYLEKVPGWINMETKRQGRQISQEAARFLADMIGTDLGQLAQAIERIILFVGDRKLIELADVETAVAETHQHTIFELANAVGTRRWPKAFALLTNVLDNGESPVFVLTMLARHFRLLSKAKEVTGRMGGEGEVAKYLGVHPYFAKDYVAQARNFSAGELRSAFRLLHRCDRELKSSRVPKARVLEKAVMELMAQKGAAPGRGGAGGGTMKPALTPTRGRSS